VTGVNHALTGAAIGATIGHPILALPIAFVSHFILDALPHFGQDYEKRTTIFKVVVSFDVLLITTLFGYLVGQAQWLALAAAILAMSPDFPWIYRFTIVEKFGSLPKHPLNKFNQFHVDIQKLESRAGVAVDALWFVSFVYILSRIL
jgi:hypothetical protein